MDDKLGAVACSVDEAAWRLPTQSEARFNDLAPRSASAGRGLFLFAAGTDFVRTKLAGETRRLFRTRVRQIFPA